MKFSRYTMAARPGIDGLLRRSVARCLPAAAVGIAIAGSGFVGCAFAQATPPSTTPNVSGRIEIPLLPAGQEQLKQNPVMVSFNGRVYKSATFTNASGKLPPEMTGEDMILPKIMSDNASGEVKVILDNWNPAEREEIAQMASNANLLAGNTTAYRGVAQSELLAKIFYGANYVIYIVRHNRTDTSYVKDYSFKRIDGKLYLTNELQADPVFQFITTKYAASLRGTRKEEEALKKP